ncbi:unnamed protein product, partial [Ectocarpus fasciculatus]
GGRNSAVVLGRFPQVRRQGLRERLRLLLARRPGREHAEQGRLRDGRQLRYRLLRGEVPRRAKLHRAHALPEQGQGGGGQSTPLRGNGERRRLSSCRRRFGLPAG